MKNILLINPQPVVLKDIFAEPIMYCNPPLGLGYLASAVRKKGFTVDIFDMGPQRLSIGNIFDEIDIHKPEIVGISSFVANHGNGVRISKKIKEVYPNVKIVMGGPHASFIAKDVLAEGYVDFISMFEGEETFVELADAIINNKDTKGIMGIAYREGEKVIINESRPAIANLDTLEFPAWDLFHIDKYTQPGIILTGRGCPYKCIFCAASVVSGAKYRMRSTKNVVDELEYIVNNFNIREFFFADDTLTANEKHCVDICREIRRRKLDIVWVAEARANTVNDFIVSEMAKAGCKHVQIGAESGDNQILKTIGKNVTTDIIENAVKTFLNHGITVVCSFILGNPDDTEETCNKTIDFAIKIRNLAHKFSTCKFAILTPLPGTPVYENMEKLGIKLLSDKWDKFTFFDPVIETKHLTRQKLQNLYLKSWMKYVQE